MGVMGKEECGGGVKRGKEEEQQRGFQAVHKSHPGSRSLEGVPGPRPCSK